jgi:tetratricopeptide (TPR) repeat protein
MGLRELVAQRNGWAESLCRQAVDAAERTGDDVLVADMGLMVAEAARRSQQTSIAAETWDLAVQRHVQAMAQPRSVQASFWVRADQMRPENAKWPDELKGALSGPLKRLGCNPEGSVDMILWACVAQAQYECGAHQQALVNFKRAETHAKGADQEWLRIAQSRCLASMGQVPAAAAILSGPMTSSDAAVVAAATAAMGSTKLQAGAYQQGAQLLNKALSQSAGLDWATKYQALADLALAQLIIGDTEPGLQALHAVQEQFAQAGERILLIHSLENELRLLEHESRSEEAEAVKARIVDLERI